MGSDLLTKVSINFASFFLVNCRNFFDRFTYDEVCLSVKCRSFLRFFVRNCLTEVLLTKIWPKKIRFFFLDIGNCGHSKLQSTLPYIFDNAKYNHNINSI